MQTGPSCLSRASGCERQTSVIAGITEDFGWSYAQNRKFGCRNSGLPAARWTTLQRRQPLNTFPFTLFRTSDHQRFPCVHSQTHHIPIHSLTMATKAATTAAVVRPPRHAVNSETCKLNSLTYRTSPASTLHSVSEGVRSPSLIHDEHQC